MNQQIQTVDHLATTERARQLHTPFSAQSQIVHFTEHRIYCCTTILD